LYTLEHGPCRRVVLTNSENTLSVIMGRIQIALTARDHGIVCTEPNIATRRKHFTRSTCKQQSAILPAVGEFGLKMPIHAPAVSSGVPGHVLSAKNCPFAWGDAWFLNGPTGVQIPNGISIGSAAFGRPSVKRFALSYRTVRLSVCPVCNVGVLWPNCWMDQNEIWHGGRPRPRRLNVR